MHTFLRPLAVTLLMGSLPGCNTKAAQCSRFIDAANRHTEQLRQTIEKLREIETKPELAQEVQTVIGAADSELSQLNFSDDQIADYRDQYRAFLTQASALEKTFTEAVRDRDPKQLNTAVKLADQVLRQEGEIVDQVNAYCISERT